MQIVVIQLFSQVYGIDFFLNNAKENSPVLNTLNNNTQLFSIDLQRIKAIYTRPRITADANILLSPIIATDNNKTSFLPVTQNATDYYGYDLAFSDGGQYQAGISISQDLFHRNKLSAFEQQTDVRQQTNLNNIQLSIVNLEYSVKYQYLLCLTIQKQVTFAKQYAELLRNEASIMQKLVEKGIYQQSDLSLIKIEQENYLALVQKYEANYKQNITDLLILCGISDTSEYQLSDLSLQIIPLKKDSLFIEKYRLDSLSILCSQKVFDIKYKPQISAFADAGMNAIYLPEFKRLGFSFGLKLSWLLYDGKQKHLLEQQNKIKLENNSFEKNNFINQNRIRRMNLLNQIASVQRQIKMKNKQLTDYDNLLRIYKLQLSQGRMSIINFVDILKKISDTKQEKLLLQMQKQILINTYNYWND